MAVVLRTPSQAAGAHGFEVEELGNSGQCGLQMWSFDVTEEGTL